MEQTIFRYSGYEMRSHSEQRWAGVMDALSVRWLYEPKTIETRHGWYLPDFYLPACGVFIEVKGSTPSREEIDKAADAEAATGCPVVFAHGDIDMQGLALIGGCLTYYRHGNAASLSSFEISKMVRGYCGELAAARMAVAGAKQRKPDSWMAGDLLAEVFSAQMDRSGLEAFKRRIHQPLNEAKASVAGQHSLIEWFICQFVASIEKNKRKEVLHG